MAKKYCNPPNVEVLFKKRIHPLEQEITNNLRRIMPINGIYDKTITIIGRDCRCEKTLWDMRIYTIFDLTNLSESKLMKKPNWGYMRVLRLRLALSKLGLTLNK